MQWSQLGRDEQRWRDDPHSVPRGLSSTGQDVYPAALCNRDAKGRVDGIHPDAQSMTMLSSGDGWLRCCRARSLSEELEAPSVFWLAGVPHPFRSPLASRNRGGRGTELGCLF